MALESGHFDRIHLLGYAERTISRERGRQVAGHLRTCAACTEVVETYLEFVDPKQGEGWNTDTGPITEEMWLGSQKAVHRKVQDGREEHVDTPAIAQYVQRGGTEAQDACLEEHLARCSKCRGWVEFYAVLVASADGAREESDRKREGLCDRAEAADSVQTGGQDRVALRRNDFWESPVLLGLSI